MKTLAPSIRALLFFTLVTGVLYPAFVTLVGSGFFFSRAKGSLVSSEQRVVGSELIAQGFTRPEYFWPRPSAVKFDSQSSGATNQSVTSSDFIKAVQEREGQGAVAEMKYASASGLDPHISREAAESQVKRISNARKIPETELAQLVKTHLEKRQWGVLGQERVNVLLLNLSLDRLSHARK